ncbi:LysR family transcriptional regulator [Paenirhodobacter sp.]|uniref:LysR family transcriptional regulator n=1 Tax=Paenirhodobacter sp. TaxID=1965326 RepID=UPI003B42153A
MVPNVNLKLLQTFLLAAEHGSFRRAAEESNRSPSAVSMQIRDLEEQVGVSLFVRTPQCVTLTPEGRLLYDQVGRAMGEVQAGLTRLAELAAQRRGHLKIACAPTLASTRLGPILMTFRARFPRSVVEVRETPPAGALVMLQAQEVELYVGPEPPNLTEVHFEPILRDRLAACVPPALDGGAVALRLADLTALPLIMLDRQTAIRALTDRIAAAAGLCLRPNYEVQNAYTAIALAQAGLGVALVPEVAVPMLPGAGYRVVPVADPGAERAIGILTLRGHVLHGDSEQLIDLIRSELSRC